MERRGLVMKLTDKTAIVMTSAGEFVRVPRLAHMEVGMETTMPAQVARGRKHRAFRWQRFGAAATAACLMVAAGVWLGASQMGDDTAFAYVAMDINPSIAFTIDKGNRVMQVVGLNPDGQTLVRELKVNQEPLKAAIQDAINEAVSHQMLPSQDAILITAAPADDSTKGMSQLPSEVKADVQSALASNTTARTLHPTVYTMQLSNSVWTAARKANISPGKLASYMIAKQEGQDLTLNQLQGQTLNQVLANSAAASNVVAALKSGNQQEIRQVLSSIENVSPPGQVVVPSPAGIKSDRHQSPGQSKEHGNHSKSDAGSNGSGNQNGSGNGATQSPPQHLLGKKSDSGITVNIAGRQFHVDVGQHSDVQNQPDKNGHTHSYGNDGQTVNQSTDGNGYHAPTDGLKMPRHGGGSTVQGMTSGALG